MGRWNETPYTRPTLEFHVKLKPDPLGLSLPLNPSLRKLDRAVDPMVWRPPVNSVYNLRALVYTFNYCDGT